MDQYEKSVDEEITRRTEWLITWYGKPCDGEFDPDCIVCRMWKNHVEFVKDVQTCLTMAATNSNE